MTTTQRLTVRSDSGALHIVAIWQTLAPCADKVEGVSARVDPRHGEECLTIDVVDVCESQLHHIAATLNQSPLPMTATVEATRGQMQAAGQGLA